MRILVIGGTRFVGRHFVEQAVQRGHEVTLFHRGRTGSDLLPGVEQRIGDRDSDLSALADGAWDATVDTCAYVPRQVHALADALDGRGGHHLLVSSVSVYAAPEGPGIDEDATLVELDDPTVEEVTGDTYGGLKVLCERAAPQSAGTAPRRSWCVRRTSWGRTSTRGASRGGCSASHGEARWSFPGRPTHPSRSSTHAANARDGSTAMTHGSGSSPLQSGNAAASMPAAAGAHPASAGGVICDTWAWTRTVTMPEGIGVTEEQERSLLAG